MKLTVFMPVYNREKYLKNSISSILNQDFNDFELLIIDDGSTDKSIEIIRSFNDKRIRLLKNKVNKGVVFTRNRGLEEAKGKYILLLDSDDIALPGRLRKQVEFIEAKEDAVIISSGYKVVYQNGREQFFKEVIEDDALIRTKMIFKNCIVNSSSILNRDILIKNKIKYREGFFYGEDYAFAIDCLKYGKIYGQPEILSQYNYGTNNSISGTVKKRREEITKNIMFYIRKEHLKNNNIYLNDKQILDICKATAQPTLMTYEEIINFINILGDIEKQNKSFDEVNLRETLNEIITEVIYFSQKVTYIRKLKLLKNLNIKCESCKTKLFLYHIKLGIKKYIITK